MMTGGSYCPKLTLRNVKKFCRLINVSVRNDVIKRLVQAVSVCNRFKRKTIVSARFFLLETLVPRKDDATHFMS
jgi:hypothetical protein